VALSTLTVCGSTNEAAPFSSVIPLRESCACVTSISFLITCWTLNDRSAMVIRSFTR
jgi:hypothetical protein